MEVPVINRLSNFDAGVSTCLQKPSFLSQIPSLSCKDEKLFQAHAFWKWGAFIIAMIASFGTIISRIWILVIQLQCYCHKSPASEPRLRNSADNLHYSDDEDEDEDDDAASWSSSSSVSHFEDDDDEEVRGDEDFRVKGSAHNLVLRSLRSTGDHSRFSWSDFSSGKSVVKLWEGLGLGLDVENDDDQGHAGRVVSVYDDKKWRVSATATSSPSTVLAAGTSESGRLSLGVWDSRVGCRIPAILAEWGPQLGRIIGVASDGVGKVYVRHDGSSLTVGDIRNVMSPLKSLTAYGLVESGSNLAVARCCEAVGSYLL